MERLLPSQIPRPHGEASGGQEVEGAGNNVGKSLCCFFIKKGRGQEAGGRGQGAQ